MPSKNRAYDYTPCPLCGQPKARQASTCRACATPQVQPDPQLSLAPFTVTEPLAAFLMAHGVGRRWGHAGRGERPATGFAPSAAIYGNSRLPRAVAAL